MEIDKLPGYGGNFAIYDTADSQNLIKQILKEMNLDDKRFQPSGILSRISNAKNALQDAAALRARQAIFTSRKWQTFTAVTSRSCN